MRTRQRRRACRRKNRKSVVQNRSAPKIWQRQAQPKAFRQLKNLLKPKDQIASRLSHCKKLTSKWWWTMNRFSLRSNDGFHRRTERSNSADKKLRSGF